MALMVWGGFLLPGNGPLPQSRGDILSHPPPEMGNALSRHPAGPCWLCSLVGTWGCIPLASQASFTEANSLVAKEGPAPYFAKLQKKMGAWSGACLPLMLIIHIPKIDIPLPWRLAS